MKAQTDYLEHDCDDLDDGWEAVSEYLLEAKLIAFDDCHKIYLAMDDNEAEFFRYGGYETVMTVNREDHESLMKVLRRWYGSSCGLRFISAVFENTEDPNAGYVRLISQDAGWRDEEENDHL